MNLETFFRERYLKPMKELLELLYSLDLTEEQWTELFNKLKGVGVDTERMKIWEKGNFVLIQLKDLTTGRMLMDFGIKKEHFEEMKNHIIKNLNEFKLADSGEKTVEDIRVFEKGTPQQTDSKPESKKKDDDHQSIADMMVDDALERGEF